MQYQAIRGGLRVRHHVNATRAIALRPTNPGYFHEI